MNEEHTLLQSPLGSHSVELDQLFTALSKFQGEVKMPEKASKGNWGAYADITDVIECIRPTLAKYGLSFMQPPIVREGNNLGLETWICHSSGQYIKSVFILKPEKDTNQGIGGSITYLRRYVLTSTLGIAAEDDEIENAPSSQPQAKVFAQDKPISDKQRGFLLSKLQNAPSGTIGKLIERFSITKLEDLRMSIFNDVLAWVDEQ